MFKFSLLVTLRKKKGLLGYEVTKMLKEKFNYNISPTTLWRFETGKSSPQVKDLRPLAKFYGVKEEDFFQGIK